MNKKILITGAGGFVGSNLTKYLTISGYSLKIISRTPNSFGDVVVYDDFMSGKYDKTFFDDVGVVIHLASIAHNFNIPSIEEMDKVNQHFTKKLLKALNIEILEKFIYLSSIAVSLLEKEVLIDTYQYGISKQKAEQLLIKFFKDFNSKGKLVILRPPLIYGKNAPGNFLKLLNLLKKPLPLPLGSLNSRRSFLFVGNLLSAIKGIIESKSPEKGPVYEISDPWVVTTSSFMRSFKAVTKAPAIIIPMPKFLLKAFFTLLGKKSIYEKLNLELVVDNSKFDQDFNWTPACKDQIEAFRKSI